MSTSCLAASVLFRGKLAFPSLGLAFSAGRVRERSSLSALIPPGTRSIARSRSTAVGTGPPCTAWAGT